LQLILDAFYETGSVISSAPKSTDAAVMMTIPFVAPVAVIELLNQENPKSG